MDKASDIHDYDKAAALMAASVGEAIGLVGVLIALKATVAGTTAGPIGTVIGFIGGLIAAVGYVIAGWAADTPIETMLKHCEWGAENAFQQSDDFVIYKWHEPWSFAQWKGHPERQMAALFNLLGQFSVETYKPDVEKAILKAQNPPVIVRFTQLFDDTRLKIQVHGTLEHPSGKTLSLSKQAEVLEPNQLLKLVEWGNDSRQSFLRVVYPNHTRKTIREKYEEGYRVKDLGMTVEVELREGKSVGSASAALYRDGEIADFNRGISTAGELNPHA
jgi:hypothetical protein